MKHPAIYSMDDQYVIYCAHCGGEFMHQRDVEVFHRDEEDSLTGLHAWIRGVEFVTTESVEGNPSGRRDAVVLGFWCEQCESTTVLEFIQHKGTEWVEVKANEPAEALAEGTTIQ